ncbi:MAG: DNA-directed RNA polymerase subunit omega, partial [Paracoccus sp. (in: a-proteobacteria)]
LREIADETQPVDDLRERMIESTQTQIEVDEPEEDAMALLLGAEIDRPKPADEESEERMLRMMLEANERG